MEPNAVAARGARPVEVTEPPAELDFSLVEGGGLYRLARALRLVRRPLGLAGPGVVLAVVTWTPLLLLAAGEGLAFRGTTAQGFLGAFGTHARLLVAIPLFFAAEAWIDPRLRHFVQYLVGARIVPPSEVGALQAAVRTASRLRDSILVEILLLGLAAAFVASGVRLELPGDVSTWRVMGSSTAARLTLAGWWYTVVALPAFQFLLGRWCWRILVWFIFLWRISRLDLRLIPTHPDLSGGLGYLGVVQSHFGTLSVAFSAVLAGVFAERMLFAGLRLQALVLPLTGLVALNLALFLGPLLLFGPRLIVVKRVGLREYGLVAAGYTRDFDRKWVRGGAPPGEPLLGSSDIQSLADLANSFLVIRHMRVVPFGLALVATLVVTTLTPMLPLLLVTFPLDELVLKAVRLVLDL